MRVRCEKTSDDICHTSKGVVITPDHMKVYKGEIYTVEREVVGYQGERKWVLKERPDNCRYKKDSFTIL